jgi:hypothetical protein
MIDHDGQLGHLRSADGRLISQPRDGGNRFFSLVLPMRVAWPDFRCQMHGTRSGATSTAIGYGGALEAESRQDFFPLL